MTSHASLKKNVLTWTVIGLDGRQTAEFVLKKMPYRWPTLASPGLDRGQVADHTGDSGLR